MHQGNRVPALVKFKAKKHPANHRAKGQKIKSGNMKMIAVKISNSNGLKSACIGLDRAAEKRDGRNQRTEGQKPGSTDLISCEKDLLITIT